MPLETLDRSPPPFFKQGPSALSRLVLLSALALFLMVADARFHIVQPLRAVIATVLYPAQWLALQPVQWVQTGVGYLTDLKTARATEEAARVKLAEQSQRAGQVEQLQLENNRLRELLALRERVQVPPWRRRCCTTPPTPTAAAWSSARGRCRASSPARR